MTNSLSIKSISTENAPLPLGHYSQAVIHENLIYISGQLPIDSINPSREIVTVEEQTLLTLKNLDSILVSSGSDKTKVLKVTIFISDLAHWPKVNEGYAHFFGDHRPARSAVPVTGLPKGFFVEIDAIAAI